MATIQTISNHAAIVVDRWIGAAGTPPRHIHLPIRPTPAARPRVARGGGVFYPPKQTAAIREAALHMKAVPEAETENPLAVLVEIVAHRPKTTKMLYPKGDVDNYAKIPLDVITKSGKVWKDDNQIVSIVCVKRFAETGEDAGINIFWREVTGEKQ